MDIDKIIAEGERQREDDAIGEDCDHICTSNCRRVGCNCECGEWHNEELL